jgi:hypothetical protein
MDWLLWLVGVVIAVIIGLAAFNIYDLHIVTDQLRQFSDGMTKALFVAFGLVAISKFF